MASWVRKGPVRNVGAALAVALPLVLACGSSPHHNQVDGGVVDGEEGQPCDIFGQPPHGLPACLPKLKCVASIFTVGVCARGCKTDTDCGKGDEVCYSYSKQAKDGHCVNKVKDAYGLCGVADTSICDNRSCLYLPNQPIGVCIDTCALDGSPVAGSDAGTDAGIDGGTDAGIDGGAGDDAGLDTSGSSGSSGTKTPSGSTAPEGAVACGMAQSCVDNVLSAPMTNEGVCGTVVARGEPCGIAHGIYCQEGDICAPEKPTDLRSKLRCFQDCSAASSKCDKGKCLVVQGLFAYCM
jgi:hypothetical protein